MLLTCPTGQCRGRRHWPGRCHPHPSGSVPVAGRGDGEGSGAGWREPRGTGPCVQGCGSHVPHQRDGGGAGARRAGTHITIPLNGGADLLRAWCDGELGLALESMSQRLLGHSCGAAHVFIAGVGTAANQTWCMVGWGTDHQEESDQSSPPDRKRSTPGQGFTDSAPNREKLEATYLTVCPLSPDT